MKDYFEALKEDDEAVKSLGGAIIEEFKEHLTEKPDAGAKLACNGLLDAQLAKTTITMFITFIQTKGAWPCILELVEPPKMLSSEELLKMKDEFVAKMCN